MAAPSLIKPAHKAIKAYYEALRRYGQQDVGHESAVRSAFQSLLGECGRQFGWTLIPEQAVPAQGKTVRTRTMGRTGPGRRGLDGPQIFLL